MTGVLRAALTIGVLLAPPANAAGQSASRSPQDLKRLTIEELTQIEVSSASRRAERLAQTAAAVDIIRDDDIRRSGATSLADIMRLADGVDVARADSRTWAISTRGFNITTANKLLVMIDGRTVYSPLFAGTLWDVQDAFFPDIDRVEIVRGPGGSLWGANAVNGVVNVIMKDAASTRGAAGFLAAGSDERVIGSSRYGGPLAGRGSYRVYGTYRHRAPERLSSGASAGDEIDFGQGGFRVESRRGRAVRWFVQGDAYRGSEGQTTGGDVTVAGGNVLGRWSRATAANGTFQAQAYYDYTGRTVPDLFDEARHTVEVDVQHGTIVRGDHEIVAGGAVRVSHANDTGSGILSFSPVGRTDAVFSGFLQDEITLQRNSTYLTLGSKFERNDFTGIEVQPTVRFRWDLGGGETFWAAVSRAVRLPSRFDTDLRIASPALRLEGSDEFEAEEVVAYEAGYRAVPLDRLSVDAAIFANRYDHLRSQEQPLTPGDPIVLANKLNAVTSGIELTARLQLTDGWRVAGSYAFLDKDLSLDAGSRDLTGGDAEGNDPAHRLTLSSRLDLPRSLELDGFFRYVGRRPDPVVPAYAELDVRLGWNLRPALEISIIGQNLLHDRHREFGAAGPNAVLFTRGAYVRTLWRF